MVSTTLDILINIARVEMTRAHVARIHNLVADVFQTMLVYRDSSSEIFCKCCALLQILTAETIVSVKLYNVVEYLKIVKILVSLLAISIDF